MNYDPVTMQQQLAAMQMMAHHHQQFVAAPPGTMPGAHQHQHAAFAPHHLAHHHHAGFMTAPITGGGGMPPGVNTNASGGGGRGRGGGRGGGFNANTNNNPHGTASTNASNATGGNTTSSANTHPAAHSAAEKANTFRNNEIGEPARVIHMRNVTPEVSQLSIQNLVASFGRIRNIVMLRQKNQALVEMETLQSAQQMVDFFKEPGYAEIDGRRVYLRYSLHNELTASVHTSKALLVSMFNTQYDVSAATQITPMIVYQIFGNYGQVEKIVVLPKNDSSAQNHNRVQALVQFETKEVAEHVKNMLQGQPVTLGETITFTLDIQFSRMEEIKTSSPHNSLVIPKGATPSSLLEQQQQQQQELAAAAAAANNKAPEWVPQ